MSVSVKRADLRGNALELALGRRLFDLLNDSEAQWEDQPLFVCEGLNRAAETIAREAVRGLDKRLDHAYETIDTFVGERDALRTCQLANEKELHRADAIIGELRAQLATKNAALRCAATFLSFGRPHLTDCQALIGAGTQPCNCGLADALAACRAALAEKGEGAR